MKFRTIMQEAGVPPAAAHVTSGLEAHTPIDGSALTYVPVDSPESIEAKIQAAASAFLVWRTVPAPVRGEMVRRFARRVRRDKQALGRLISLETGKILSLAISDEAKADILWNTPSRLFDAG